MPKRKASETNEDLELDLGTLNPKQLDAVRELLFGKAKYICYGGAKGGGKTHYNRTMATVMSLLFPGIDILVIRATFDDVRQNLIEPMIKMLPREIYSYNGTTHKMTFSNNSVIQFRNWSGMDAETKYQGQEYDMIVIDEATQFTERMFRHLAGCLRGTKKRKKLPKGFKRKIILTCNPGGIGHFWVKRLFIERKFRVDEENPEKTERPEDYAFIFARAEDNVENIKENPDYLEIISQMANSDAMRYGDWDILGGNYFTNFDSKVHVRKKFVIPEHWKKFRSFDYGLDLFACFWWAVDEDGRCWCYRGYEKDKLNISKAIEAMKAHSMPDEDIVVTFAPPDMWSRQRESGKSTASLFQENGVPLIRSENNRIQGHLMVRNMLDPIPLTDKYVIEMYGGEDKAPRTLPMLMFFDCIGQAIEDMQAIQADEEEPNDCAKKPHDVTHTVDAIRYFCISRTLPTEAIKEAAKPKGDPWYDDDEKEEEILFGGEADESYINFGCM